MILTFWNEWNMILSSSYLLIEIERASILDVPMAYSIDDWGITRSLALLTIECLEGNGTN